MATFNTLEPMSTNQNAGFDVSRVNSEKIIRFPGLTFKPRAKFINYPRNLDRLTSQNGIEPYRKPTKKAKMFQMSMKYIPVVNIEPKPYDPPYLFKVGGHDLGYSKIPKRVSIKDEIEVDLIPCIPRPKLDPKTTTPPPPPPPPPPPRSAYVQNEQMMGLRCPKDPTTLMKLAHENFVLSYVDFYNKNIDPIDEMDTQDDIQKLSIACNACCLIPPRPKELPEDEVERKRYIPPPDYDGPIGFFPDFDSLFIGKVPQGTAGYRDGKGIFHPAQMGDALPVDDRRATIGYVTKRGVFRPVLNIFEGIKKGIIGIRNANTTEIAPVAPGYRRYFNPPITAYQDGEGNIYHVTSHDQIGYIDKHGVFHEGSSRSSIPEGGQRAIKLSMGVIIPMINNSSKSSGQPSHLPLGAIGGYIDENGEFYELKPGESMPENSTGAFKTMDGDVVLRTHFSSLSQVLAGAMPGYIQHDSFYVLRDGEEFIPGRVQAIRKLANGKVIPVGFSKLIPTTAFAGRVSMAAGKFYRMNEGDDIPAHSLLAYEIEGKIKLWDTTVGYFMNDEFFPLNDDDIVPFGATIAYQMGPGGKIVPQRPSYIPEGNLFGYMENGEFHELHKGEGIPRGSTLAYAVPDGTYISLGSIEALEQAKTRESFSLELKKPIIRFGSEIITKRPSNLPSGAIFGYVIDGVFYELKQGDDIPQDTILAQKTLEGEIIELESGMDFERFSSIQENLKKVSLPVEVPLPVPVSELVSEPVSEPVSGQEPLPLLVPVTEHGQLPRKSEVEDILAKRPSNLPYGAIFGYIINGVFHELNEDEVVPEGTILAHTTVEGHIVEIGIATGVERQSVQEYFSPLQEHPIRKSEDGKIVPKRPSNLPKDDKFGYIKNGSFYELNNNEAVPEGTILVRTTVQGQIVELGIAKAVQTNSIVESLHPITEHPIIEFKEMKVVPKRPSNIHEDDMFGYTKNGVFHELEEGEVVPHDTILAHATPDGRIIQLGPVNVAQKISLEKLLLEINQEPTEVTKEVEIIPKRPSNLGEADTFGYTKDGVFYELKESEAVPEGTIVAYNTTEGEIVQLGPAETFQEPDVEKVLLVPEEEPKVANGYIDGETGKFHELEEGTKVPPGEGNIPAYKHSDGSLSIPPVVNELETAVVESESNNLDEYFEEGTKMAYRSSDGAVHVLHPGETIPPDETAGFISRTGRFSIIPEGTEVGYMDKLGDFITLEPGESPPPDIPVGYRDIDNGVFQVVTPSPPLHHPSPMGYKTEDGIYHDIQPGGTIPKGAVILKGVVGYLDKETLDFHEVKAGANVPDDALLIYRPIHEELAEIPQNAKPSYRTSDGQIHDLTKGQVPPVGTTVGYVQNGEFHRQAKNKKPLKPDEDGDIVDLRHGVPLTAEEREAFEEFKQSLGVQCDLELVEGSLDLGEVFRKTFRIYSHGASVDIDKNLVSATSNK